MYSFFIRISHNAMHTNKKIAIALLIGGISSIMGIVSAAPVISHRLGWSTITCADPGIDCTGTTVTILEDAFPYATDNAWFRSYTEINGADTIIVEWGNFLSNPGESFEDNKLQDFFLYADFPWVTSIIFNTWSLQAPIGDDFMAAGEFINLTSIEFPSWSLQHIDDTFLGHYGPLDETIPLQSIAFPDNSLQTVGDGFMESRTYPQMTQITFPAGGLQTIGTHFMNGSEFPLLENFDLPEWSIQSAGRLFLYQTDLSSLTSFTIPSGSLATLPDLAFYEADLSSVTEFIIADGSFVDLGTEVLLGADLSSLTELTFPEGSLQSADWEEWWFMEWGSFDALQTITFPPTIDSTFFDGSHFVGNTFAALMFIEWVAWTSLASKWTTIGWMLSIFPNLTLLAETKDIENITQSETSDTISALTINENDIVKIVRTYQNTIWTPQNVTIQGIFGETSQSSIAGNSTLDAWIIYKVFDPNWFKNWAN